MTPASISVLYRWLSFGVLLLGISVPYFWMEGSMWAKVTWGVKLNLEFHIGYLFLRWLSLYAHRRISRRGPVAANHARQVLMIFSWLVMILSVFALVDMVNNDLKSRQYVNLAYSMTNITVFLAAYSVFLTMKAKPREPEQTQP